MSDSERSGSETEWELYRERSEWSDISGVPQEDAPGAPIVSISYSDKFKDVYDYFRAVLQKKEKSIRALHLTKDALELNPANYTVWQYRRELLQSLEVDLIDELNYLQTVIESNPKNYQVWHHRRVIVEWIKDSSLELQLTAIILDQDPKNYHAWQHRQWVIKTFNLFDRELEFVDSLLSSDVRNNSAWNQRYFVINNTTGFTEEIIKREIEYTLGKIKHIKNNESAWNYLRGVLFFDDRGITGVPEVVTFCEDLYDSGSKSPYLLALIIDMCDEVVIKGSQEIKHNVERGVVLCKDMAEKYDVVRCKYWNFIGTRMIERAKKKDNTNSIETKESSAL